MIMYIVVYLLTSLVFLDWELKLSPANGTVRCGRIGSVARRTPKIRITGKE